MENTYMDHIENFGNFTFYVKGCDTVEKTMVLQKTTVNYRIIQLIMIFFVKEVFCMIGFEKKNIHWGIFIFTKNLNKNKNVVTNKLNELKFVQE